MHQDANQLRVLSVTPVIPLKSQAYVLLTFLTSNDARSFKSKLSHLKKEDKTLDKVYTNRWTISSSELIAGDADAIKLYQDSIISYYNEHMEINKLPYKLERFHGNMLRIEPKTRYVRSQVHILIEFTDLCDKVSKLIFYENNDPFACHDFSNEIPNPKAREYAANNTSYKKCTLKEYGLYRQVKRQ